MTVDLDTFFRNRLKTLAGRLKHKKFVLAVSGGVDSMVMMHLALQVLEPEQCVIAHFNHKIRGLEADLDERFVHLWAKTHGLSFARGERQGSACSEAALRKERHDFLKSVLKDENANFVILAHHLEDQFETFLMRLIRGSGMRGLSGIAAKNGRILRPLLATSRLEIEAYAKANAVRWREDSSNAQTTYFRNRLRHTVTPALYRLAQEYGGRVKFLKRFEKTRRELQSVALKNTLEAEQLLSGNLHTTDFWSRIALSFYMGLSNMQQQEILRGIWIRMGAELPSRETINRVRRSIHEGKRSLSIREIQMSESCGQLYFQTKKQKSLIPTLSFKVFENKISCAELGLELRALTPHAGLEWRQWRAGDRFEKKKLKQILLKERIPKLERCLLPVLAKRSSSEVVWYYPKQHAAVVIERLIFPFAHITAT